ncbi:hypothetical protein QTN25_010633 [Entamoeba marina]
MLSLSTQLRMFPKLQHISGDLLSFQNLVSLKQLQRISSFENENRNILTPIESIHKAFIGRVKQLNITYPFPDLIKFKKLEEIRISFNREYLNKKHSHEKILMKKIRYLRMLKRIILYDITKDMFNKNIRVFGDVSPSIQLYIYYEEFIKDSDLDSLPTNIHIITSKNYYNKSKDLKASWNPQLDLIAFKQLEKAYLPTCIQIDYTNTDGEPREVIDLNPFINCGIRTVTINSDFRTLSSPSVNLPIKNLTITGECHELYLGKTNIKHLVVFNAEHIYVNSALETIQCTGNKECIIKYDNPREKECLSIIVNSMLCLTIKNINKLCFTGGGIVKMDSTNAKIIELDNVLIKPPTYYSSCQWVHTLIIKNNRSNSELNLKYILCSDHLNLTISNCKFKKKYISVMG